MRESECKVGSVQQLQLKRVEWLRVALLRVELSKFGGTSSAYGVNGRHAEAMPRPPSSPQLRYKRALLHSATFVAACCTFN